MPRTAAVTFALLLAAAAPAVSGQIRPGDNGVLLAAKAGNFGNLCHGFTCTPFQGTVAPNENVTLYLRGPNNAPFWLFVAPTARLCIAVPGLRNSLILSPPFLLVATGALDEQDGIRACPGGLKTLRFTVPLPKATRFALQNVVMAQWLNGPEPTFSPAIEVLVQ